jgi:hypothetical protein
MIASSNNNDEKISMNNPSEDPISLPDHNKSGRTSPHQIALISIWIASSLAAIIMLILGVRETGRFHLLRYILQVAYVIVLIWYLFQTSPSPQALPELRPVVFPQRTIGKLIPAVLVLLIFIAELGGLRIIKLLLMPAAILILIVRRREIRLSSILIGLGAAAVAYLTGLPFILNQYLSTDVFLIFLAFVPPMFIAGSLLSKNTGLGRSQLFENQYKNAGLSFLGGCLLFIPLGLINAAGGAPGPWMTWIDQWWMPLTQPWFSGIVEEVWNRLILVPLIYFLLRPAFSKRPSLAVFGSLIFSAVTFGLTHGGTLVQNVLNTGMLFGFPMAVVFARRDWEHAVGAHYMINLVPTILVFLNQ